MEDITNACYAQAKELVKTLGEYHDLYVQGDTLLLADHMKTFEIYILKYMSLILETFLSAPGLSDLLSDIDMLLRVEKDIRRGISHTIYRHAKANNKYMKDYVKHKRLSHLQYSNVNYLDGWAMSLKLPVSNFEWMEDTFQFNEDFIKKL